MRVARFVSVGLVLGACGRIGFDPRSDAGQNGSDAAGICMNGTLVPSNAPVGSSLVAAHTHDGYLVLWSNPGGNPLLGMHLDEQFGTPGPIMVNAVTDPDVGGLTDISGMVYLLATRDTANLAHWRSLQYDLTQQSDAMATAPAPLPHDTMISDVAHTSFVFADISGANARMRYFFGNAFDPTGTSVNTGMALGGISGDDGPGHAHVGWVASASQTCFTGHVLFQSNPVLMQDSASVTDCQEMRIASGPSTDDKIALGYSNTAGELFVRYGATSWDLGPGVAIRVRFAAGAFWAVYLSSSGSLDVARLALDGTHATYHTNAFPIGHAYALVTDGTHIAVVSLVGTALDIMPLTGC